MPSIKIRTRIYLAVEGEGEQSFVRLLQEFANQNGLYVHLDCQVLDGGGYEPMFKRALLYRQCAKKQKNKVKSSILLIDADRDQRKDDGWTLLQLKQEAGKSDLQVCVQDPNQEGLLFRMLPRNENKQPSVLHAHKQLLKEWPNYQKPADFYKLRQKFNLNDLLRVAKFDKELSNLLTIIGLK
mgnify:CR=1 FL=1|jgi:hypothetical protein